MRPAGNPARGYTLKLGDLVFTGEAMGIGKVSRIEGKRCAVRFLYSIAHSEERTYPLTDLRHATLAPQTRVYAQGADDAWRIGRVVDGYMTSDETLYDVAFPNGHQARIPETALHVRCYGSRPDPTEVLAWNGMETQYFHDRRLEAMRAILEARAVGRGLTGLMSASVALVPHQIEVVRRVLEDPIQRYLLADEVGMGKTIEAGAIIRQCLLENPNAHIIVLTPQPLLRQWEQELMGKFHLDDFPTSVVILPFEDLPALAAETCDLLVIDEAHHLISRELNATACQSGLSDFQRLAQLAHASKRLLLLSATPIIGNEEATLALLHLLDPAIYHLEDREEFRQKLERRQEYGRLLLMLGTGSKPFVRRMTARKLRETFPDDAEVVKWAAQLEPNDDPDNQTQADRTVHILRQHIAETYRLHQRLIRSRRKDTEGWELQPRQGRLTVDVDPDERMSAVYDALVEWRYQAQRSSSRDTIDATKPDDASDTETADPQEQAMARRYRCLVEALGIGIDNLAAEWRQQWEEVQAGRLPTFANEADLNTAFTSAFSGDSGPDTRHDVAAQAIALAVKAAATTTAPKVVAFTSSSRFGRELHTRLVSEHGRGSVCAILEGDSSEEIDQAIERFASSPQAAIMLCDRSGEEGFNFHFAHTVVHLDLPFDPERIEQRIGRVDRFGRPYPTINQRIILPNDDDRSPWTIWLQVLEHGFHIFRESVSEVQFLLDGLALTVELALFRSGAHVGASLIDLVQKQLSEERIRLDEQYALDQLDIREDVTAALSPELKAFEADTSHFGHALDGWIQRVLNLHDWQLDSAHHVFKLLWGKHALIPKDPWYAWFLQGLNELSTYKRASAIAHSEVHLLRPGAPLIDTVERYITWDDRGTAFATWRVAPQWASKYGSEWLGFRLCYVVEANVRHQLGCDGVLETRDQLLVANIQRRADAIFSPTLTVLHLDIGFEEVTDVTLLDILCNPYDKGNRDGSCDYNLGSHREALFQLVEHTDFVRLCREARSRSESLLRESASFKTLVATATRRAQAELWMRNERLRQRAAAIQREGFLAYASLTDIEREIAVNDAVIASVANPSVRLDAIGFFVVAAEPPGGKE